MMRGIRPEGNRGKAQRQNSSSFTHRVGGVARKVKNNLLDLGCITQYRSPRSGTDIELDADGCRYRRAKERAALLNKRNNIYRAFLSPALPAEGEDLFRQVPSPF
jgi:hypothetical protein